MKEKICPTCEKGILLPADDIVSEIEGLLFVEKGERCNNCGEEFIPEEIGQRTINIAKKLGVWGESLKLFRKLSKSGRGTVLRIPSDIEKNLHLTGDENVAISRVGKRKIMIEFES